MMHLNQNILFVICLSLIFTTSWGNKNENEQDQNLSDTFKFEGAGEGIQRVNLKCGSESMHVLLETEKPFTGVMYTKGSFYNQNSPCFVKPSNPITKLEMNFSLEQCQTQKDGDLFSNVVVIQNDPEIVAPGDSAFSLECDFRQPRTINVEADMQTRDRNPQKLRGSARNRE